MTCSEPREADSETSSAKLATLGTTSALRGGVRTLGPAAAYGVGPYSYVAAGCTIHVSKPRQSPELWTRYISGALTSYRRFGVESVLEYDSVISGDSTSLFFAAVGNSCGTVLGGMRVQGPYLYAERAHALIEWAGRDGTEQLHQEIEGRIPHGVIEMKTGWVAANAPRKRELTAALARVFLHSIRLTGVRYALGTVATHAVPKWSTSGGEICTEVTPVAYPDPRYRTVPMWWDRDKQLQPSLAALMDDEHHRLRMSGTPVGTAESDRAA